MSSNPFDFLGNTIISLSPLHTPQLPSNSLSNNQIVMLFFAGD